MDIATTLDSLAFLYADSNRADKAEKAFDEALEIYKILIDIDSKRYGVDYANSVVFAFYCTSKTKYNLDKAKEILQAHIRLPRAKQLLEFIEELYEVA